VTAPFGNVTAVAYDTAPGNRVTEVQRIDNAGGSAVVDSYLYTYLPATDPYNPGRLLNVTLRRPATGRSTT
jgi:hypothetical protein